MIFVRVGRVAPVNSEVSLRRVGAADPNLAQARVGTLAPGVGVGDDHLCPG